MHSEGTIFKIIFCSKEKSKKRFILQIMYNKSNIKRKSHFNINNFEWTAIQMDDFDRTLGSAIVYLMTYWIISSLRTPAKCYMQSTKLEVDLPVSGECGRPKKTCQDLTKGVADTLNCPLRDYIDKLNSYNIPSSLKWYKVSFTEFCH